MHNKKILLTALFLLAASGLMLHYRIHNFMVHDRINPEIVTFDGARFLSFLFPLLDVVAVTALFTSRKTCIYGYLFNGIIVIYGTVFMAHYSLAEFAARSVPPSDWFFKSTLPDIGIAWADFFTGKALYDVYLRT
ncbi:MAG: hypothetical protein HZA16_14695 [Nitrospirae bacterium]|nr:hypothetical protein [Nitrospirota bacterium]